MERKTLFKFIVAALIIVIIVRMLNKPSQAGPKRTSEGWVEDNEEYFTDYDPMMNNQETIAPLNPATPAAVGVTQSPSNNMMTTQPPSVTLMPTTAPLSVSADLLPKPSNTAGEFAEFAPKSLGGQNFLDASKFIGVDTVGNSLKNANYQLRRDVPIERKDVGPWQNSTVTADLYRKPLDC